MDKATASITPRSVKPKGSVRRQSTLEVVSRGSPSPSTSGEKPLPRYLRASTGSCHDLCKFGRKHESEEKPNNQLRRKLLKNLTMSDVNNKKSSLIPEERKKHSINMKSSSLKNMEVSYKTKIIRQKDSSRSIEAGTSKKIVEQELQKSSPTHIESATGNLALNSASSNIEVVQVKSVEIGNIKKKPSFGQNSYTNRNASTEMPAMSMKAVQKNLSLKSENGAHGKPSIPKEKANSSLQKATESFKAKLTKKTSLKNDVVQDVTRNPVQKTPVHPKVIHPSVQTSLKTIKKSPAKTESQLSFSNSLISRRNKGDGNNPSMSLGIKEATKDEGLKVSASSLSTKLAAHGESRLKTKKHMNEKMTSKENQVIGKGRLENDNIEEKKMCTLEIKPEYGTINRLKQGDEMVVNIGPGIFTETLPVADILDLLEPEPVLMDNTKFHSLHQGSLEPGINDMLCLEQKGDDDQLSQKLTELEKLSMGFVQKNPNDGLAPQKLVIPEDISVDSLQRKKNDFHASEELQKPEEFSADIRYKTQSLDILSYFHMENMTTSESVDLFITQQEFPTPESNNANIDFSSQQLKSLALENQDLGITQQEFPTPENDAVEHLKQGDGMVVSMRPDIVTETMPVAEILGYSLLEPEPVVMDNTKFHSLHQGSQEPGTNDLVCLEQKGDDDQLSQKLTELEILRMGFVQQIPNDDQAPQELVISEDISAGSVQQRRNDLQASEELQISEDFIADTQYKIQSQESARSDFHMKKMTTSESVDFGITKQELAIAESTTLDIDFSSQQLKSLAPENQDLDITKQKASPSEKNSLDEEVHSDQPYQVESDDEAEMDDIGEEDSIYTESSEYESENDLSKHNGNGQSSKTTEKRPRRTAIEHPHDSSAPHKLKFRKGKTIEPQLESNSPKRLRFRRPRVGTSEHDNQVGRKSFRRAKTKDAFSDNPDPEAKSVVLRHQDMQEKKDTLGLFNNVIEETASKLAETRKSKVKALVGAFETVISLQDSNSASTS